MLKKLKIYISSSLALTSLCILIYIACILFAFDAPIAYFSQSSLLPYVAKYLLILSLIGVGTLLFLIPKNALSCSAPQHSKPSRISAVLVAVSFIIYFALRFIISSNGYLQPTNLFFACEALSIISAIFYLLTAITPLKESSTRAILLIPTIIWAATAMTEAYTNRFATMNSPMKLFLMLSMMSVMFFALYEARYLISRPCPRAYIVSSLIGVCLSSVFSISFLVMQFSGKHSIMEFLPTAIVSLAFSIYKLCRALDFLNHQSSEANRPITSNEDTSTENI